LPDLADYHKEKFWNFVRINLETYEELFKLADGLMLLVRAWRTEETSMQCLLPDLADYHKQKFWNFVRMDFETFEELFKLADGLML